MHRKDGRAKETLRPVQFKPSFQTHKAGAVLFQIGDTLVHCAASLEDKVPPFLDPLKEGWLTAEYNMLPTATGTRNQRDSKRSKPNGRTIEISRLIGRSLRQAVDLTQMPGKTILLDCDVLQADGGTRTAAITGASVALYLATRAWLNTASLTGDPFLGHISAVSCGMVDGALLLDLDYKEDSRADTDMNLVTDSQNRLVEVQVSAEGNPVAEEDFQTLLLLARKGTLDLLALQKDFANQNETTK